MIVFFDTAPLIYLLDREHTKVRAQIERWLESGEDFASSYVTLTELLVHPKRLKDHRRAGRYRLYLDRLLTLALIAIDGRVAELAASIRAEFGFKTPDAFQLAAAMAIGADIFYTNDRDLQKFDGLDIVLVES